jgi:putative transcriptional regulator
MSARAIVNKLARTLNSAGSSMSALGQRLIRAAKDARAIVRGEAIRRKLRMSQDTFAQRFGFTAARARDWEQRRPKPDGAIRAYLIGIEREAVERALTHA